jgi:hypothetical protein
VRTRAHREAPHTDPQTANGHEDQKQTPAQAVTKPGQPDPLKLGPELERAYEFGHGQIRGRSLELARSSIEFAGWEDFDGLQVGLMQRFSVNPGVLEG